MVTEINDVFVQIAVIHGSLSECSSELPGIFVRLDNPNIFAYLQKELGLESTGLTEMQIENQELLQGGSSTMLFSGAYFNGIMLSFHSSVQT